MNQKDSQKPGMMNKEQTTGNIINVCNACRILFSAMKHDSPDPLWHWWQLRSDADRHHSFLIRHNVYEEIVGYPDIQFVHVQQGTQIQYSNICRDPIRSSKPKISVQFALPPGTQNSTIIECHVSCNDPAGTAYKLKPAIVKDWKEGMKLSKANGDGVNGIEAFLRVSFFLKDTRVDANLPKSYIIDVPAAYRKTRPGPLNRFILSPPIPASIQVTQSRETSGEFTQAVPSLQPGTSSISPSFPYPPQVYGSVIRADNSQVLSHQLFPQPIPVHAIPASSSSYLHHHTISEQLPSSSFSSSADLQHSSRSSHRTATKRPRDTSGMQPRGSVLSIFPVALISCPRLFLRNHNEISRLTRPEFVADLEETYYSFYPSLAVLKEANFYLSTALSANRTELLTDSTNSTPSSSRNSTLWNYPSDFLARFLFRFVHELTIINTHEHLIRIKTSGSILFDNTRYCDTPPFHAETINRLKITHPMIHWKCEVCNCISEPQAIKFNEIYFLLPNLKELRVAHPDVLGPRKNIYNPAGA